MYRSLRVRRARIVYDALLRILIRVHFSAFFLCFSLGGVPAILW